MSKGRLNEKVGVGKRSPSPQLGHFIPNILLNLELLLVVLI
jgi:hypothetical protein